MGDSGDLPGTSQEVGPPGPLPEIQGTVNTSADRDVFKVCLTGGGDFSATTVGGTGFDSQLFLLNAEGRGVYANDDGGAPGPSTLPAGHSLTPRAPGVYYLAISHYDFDPVSQSGAIFPNRTSVVGPTGRGGADPMTGWTGTGSAPAGGYTIFLTGARSCIPPDTTAPVIRLRTPAPDAVYERDELVTADYECVEEDGGSGLASCDGTVPSGDLVDTSKLGTHTFTVTTADKRGNTASLTHHYTVEDRTPPEIAIQSPLDGAAFTLGQPVAASYGCSDEEGGSGLVSCDGDVAPGAAIDTGSLGWHSFTVRARDGAGNTAEATVGYTVLFGFHGFLRPVANPPAVNTVKAGHQVKIKFSLGGYHGSKVVAAGYPRSADMPCRSDEDAARGEPTRGRLRYERRRRLYVYAWKTHKRWAGTCREFVMKLADGSEHRANFRFVGRRKPPKPAKPEGGGRPGKPGKPEGGGKPENPGDPGKPEKPAKPEKPDGEGKPENPGNQGKPEKPAKPEKPPKPEKPAKPEKPKPSKPDRDD